MSFAYWYVKAQPDPVPTHHDRGKKSLGKQKSPRLGDQGLLLRALEPRVLLDAAAAATVAAASEQHHAPSAEPAAQSSAELIHALAKSDSAVAPTAPNNEQNAAPNTPAPANHEVYFIDAAVADGKQLAGQLPNGAEVHYLQAGSDGIEQIAQVLDGRTDISAIHIFSHGSEGQLQLGDATLNTTTMQGEYRDELASIGRSLSADGDILLYGCDFAEGQSGIAATQLLAALTNADVAASNDDTGAAKFGGDWQLEYSSGAIETTSVAVANWDHLMAPPVIDLNGTAAAATGFDYTVNYVEGALNGVALTAQGGTGATLTDSDGDSITSLTVTISNGQAGDWLYLNATPANGISYSYDPAT